MSWPLVDAEIAIGVDVTPLEKSATEDHTRLTVATVPPGIVMLLTVTVVVLGTGPPAELDPFEDVVSSGTLASVSSSTAVVPPSVVNEPVHAPPKHPCAQLIMTGVNTHAPAPHDVVYVVNSAPEQVAGGGLQGEHEVPHEEIDVSSAHVAPHAWKPESHVKPHTPPVQIALPFAGTGHVVHEAPHALGSTSLAHDEPHAWKVASHVKPQAPAAQIATLFAGAEHAVHEAPHAVASVSLTHDDPHA